MKTYEIKAKTQRKTYYVTFKARSEYEAIGLTYEYIQTEDGKFPAKKLNKRYVKILELKEVYR